MAGGEYVMGQREIEDALAELGKKGGNKIMRKGLRAGAKVTQKAAQAAAPVGETGLTREALKVRAGKRKKGLVTVLAAIARASIPGPAFYPAFVMYGHRVGKGKDRTAPDPWYRRAFDATASAAHHAILRKITEIFEPEVKALAKGKVKA